MLPQPYRNAYDNAYDHLRQALLSLVANLEQHEPELSVLSTAIATLQVEFQSQVLSLNPDTLKPSQQQHLQAIQTEIHKYLRLLNTDLAFLKAARQTSTRQQRYALLRDRLQTLIRLCDYSGSLPN